jgi:phage shock protein PspC (stress-responsive transcriptional regulator)
MIDGVCGGTAEFFGVDPTLVRVAWLLLALAGGLGVILYILAMIIMPKNPGTEPVPAAGGGSSARDNRFWGILLVVVGALWFLHNVGLSFWWRWWHLPWDVMLSVLLILAGVAFLFGGRNGLQTQSAPVPEGSMAPADMPKLATPRLFKSRTERKIFGVCGGMGVYFGIDPTIVRVAFVLAALASFGFALLLYALLAIVVPRGWEHTVNA